jgi:hypothetical protein
LILLARFGSILSFGRKIVVLTLSPGPHDLDLNSLLMKSKPESKLAFFEKGSSAGAVNRSWMSSRWIVISAYFSLVIAPFLDLFQFHIPTSYMVNKVTSEQVLR